MGPCGRGGVGKPGSPSLNYACMAGSSTTAKVHRSLENRLDGVNKTFAARGNDIKPNTKTQTRCSINSATYYLRRKLLHATSSILRNPRLAFPDASSGCAYSVTTKFCACGSDWTSPAAIPCLRRPSLHYQYDSCTADEGQLAQIPRAATRRTQDLDSRVMSAHTQCRGSRLHTALRETCNMYFSKVQNASSFAGEAGQGRFTAITAGSTWYIWKSVQTYTHDCRALPARCTCLWHDRQMSASQLHCFRASGPRSSRTSRTGRE